MGGGVGTRWRPMAAGDVSDGRRGCPAAAAPAAADNPRRLRRADPAGGCGRGRCRGRLGAAASVAATSSRAARLCLSGHDGGCS